MSLPARCYQHAAAVAALMNTLHIACRDVVCGRLPSGSQCNSRSKLYALTAHEFHMVAHPFSWQFVALPVSERVFLTTTTDSTA